MKVWVQLCTALMIGLLFGGLLIGAFSLAFVESSISTEQALNERITTASRKPVTATMEAVELTSTLTSSRSQISAATPASNSVPTSMNETCYSPADWIIYDVRPGDTLSSLSQRVNADISQLQFANCLGNSVLIYVGQQLRLPRIPVSTATPTPTITPTPTPTRTPTAAIWMLPSSTATDVPPLLPPTLQTIIIGP